MLMTDALSSQKPLYLIRLIPRGTWHSGHETSFSQKDSTLNELECQEDTRHITYPTANTTDILNPLTYSLNK